MSPRISTERVSPRPSASSRSSWRSLLAALVVPGLLCAFAVSAVAAPASSSALSPSIVRDAVTAQFDFSGMDLSDDDKPKKKKKKASSQAKKKSAASTKKAATSRSKKKAKPAATDTADDFSGLDLSDKKAVATPSTPSSTPAASGGSSSGMSFGLDLNDPSSTVTDSTPAAAPPPTTAPVMSFDAVDVAGKSAERQRLDAAIKLFNDKRYETSALALHELLKDPNMAELHDEARYTLAKTFYRMGLYHSALNNFRQLLDKGEGNNKFFKTSLEWLFYIARKTVNEQVVLDEIAKHANADFPERFRSEFRYLLARYHFNRGKAFTQLGQADDAKSSFDEARKLILMIPVNDPFFTKTKYLEGVIFFAQGDFEKSLESFKEVVRLNNPRTNPQADMKLREMSFMQLARTHYGHRQNRYAVFYYDKVERGSDEWLEALFEASWAHYRIGEYERALGNLITLASPFFKDEYFPEALILKAVIYYENCRYREARAILEEFEKTYMPVHDELERITNANTDAAGYWEIFTEVQKRNRASAGGTSWILERILSLALTDRDLKVSNDIIQEVEAEIDGIRKRSDLFKFSELAKATGEDLKTERRALMEKAGIMAKAKLEFELGQLKGLLGQALRIKFETSTQEKKFLEEAIASQGKTEVVQKYGHSVAVADQQVYWPYQGEYWRDELGTYEYTLTKGCRPTK
ncbi:MAG: adventurous gliding motility protein GltC [Myxococcales bacterium]|nr:adventurous gliding motility protein GltC [Myxococcales bacterium]